ncbi:MAG: aminoacyl-tRNA hydrolase [Planctomycetota bacterium]
MKRIFRGLFGAADSQKKESAHWQMIVGLGNPGKKYEQTRHNIGFKVIELLAERLGTEVKRKKFGGLTCQAEFGGKKLILLKPMNFMNRSGQPVATACGFYRLLPSDILVITDDMALEVGYIRLRAKGSAGSHNGLADIIAKLGSSEFCRLRIGIGRSAEEAGREYVLSVAPKEEQEVLNASAIRACDACLCWLESGIETAMNRYN